jgi:hypothetical protein
MRGILAARLIQWSCKRRQSTSGRRPAIEGLSGHAIEHLHWYLGFAAVPTIELGAKANAVHKLWSAAIRKFRKVQLSSGGTRIPTTESSRQCGIWRFWVTLSLPCRIAAYSNVMRLITNNLGIGSIISPLANE